MFKKLSVIFLILFFVSSAFAGNIILPPGARASNYGGAFTAIADDGTAIYWNPAGLADQEKSNFTVSGYYVNQDATASQSLPIGVAGGNDTFQKYSSLFSGLLASEPDNFNNNNYQTCAFLPFVSYFAPKGDYVFAVGAYATGGGGGKWESTVKAADNISDVYGKVEGCLSLLVFNVSAAKEVSDVLSLGAGVNLIYMQDELEIKQTYTTSGTEQYSSVLEKKADGYGLEATTGAIYKPQDELSIGLTIRSGSKIKINGDAKLNGSGYLSANDYETGYEEKYQFPLTVSLGSAYDFSEKFIASAQIDYYNYSSMKKHVNYNHENITLKFKDGNSDYHKRWRDIYVFSIGGEYKATNKLSLFGGYKYEPSPYYKNSINLLETNQYTYDIYSLGGEYRFDAGYIVGLNVLIVESRGLKNNGIDYDYDSLVYRATVSYNF